MRESIMWAPRERAVSRRVGRRDRTASTRAIFEGSGEEPIARWYRRYFGIGRAGWPVLVGRRTVTRTIRRVARAASTDTIGPLGDRRGLPGLGSRIVYAHSDWRTHAADAEHSSWRAGRSRRSPSSLGSMPQSAGHGICSALTCPTTPATNAR